MSKRKARTLLDATMDRLDAEAARPEENRVAATNGTEGPGTGSDKVSQAKPLK